MRTRGRFSRGHRNHWGRWILGGVIGLGILAGVAYGVGDWMFRTDPDVRRWYNVLRAEPYRYEGVPPFYAETNPETLVARLKGPADLDARRRALSTAVFGTPLPPRSARPDRVERMIDPATVPALAPYLGRSALAGVDRLTVNVDAGYTARAYHLHPARPRGAVVLWQQGYAATIADAAPLLLPLLEQGYDVVALNYHGDYGENDANPRVFDGYGLLPSSGWSFLYAMPLPLRRYFLPPLAAVNQVMEEVGTGTYHMAGISAGGWVTVVLSALDERVRRSYPMAGVYPLYLQQQANHPPPPEQSYPPLLQAASYTEMFVMAAQGRGRGQSQFFGQYDRCCQSNRFAELYAPTVAKVVVALGGGHFGIHINTTSPDHRINEDYVDGVLADLRVADGKPAP